jgi:predicted DsbA family dithiol-disulfide isomerase
MRRRDIIGGIALLAAPVVLFRSLASDGDDEEFDFRPIPSAPGFRSLAGGAVSATSDPFIGLNVPGAEPAPEPIGMTALCGVLFGDDPAPDGVVPVAYFTDYNCPYCGRLSARLREREDEGLRLSWHELPLLGESSEAAARAALAAGRQGGYADFHARLMRASFQPTEAYVAELATGLGLDPERLLSDMNGAGVSRELTDTRRTAARLGIGATPTLVVGRTVVTGLIGDERLDALLAREAEDGPLPC